MCQITAISHCDCESTKKRRKEQKKTLVMTKKGITLSFIAKNGIIKHLNNMLIRKKVLNLQQNLHFVNKRWQKEELGCASHQVPQGHCI